MGLLTGMEKEKRHSIQGQMCRKITWPFLGILGVIEAKIVGYGVMSPSFLPSAPVTVTI